MRFSEGDTVWVWDPTMPLPAKSDKLQRVEWVEQEVRLTGVVKPGMPSKLNTKGPARGIIFSPFKGTIVRVSDQVPPRGGDERYDTCWDVWDPEEKRERVFPENYLMSEAEWELLHATRGLSDE